MSVADVPRICIYCGTEILWSDIFASWRHAADNAFMCRVTYATPTSNPLEEWTPQDWKEFFEGYREDPNGRD